jgi:exodeoxyribonuclease-5
LEIIKRFSQHILDSFPYEPTSGQLELIEKLSSYVISTERTGIFILKGFAGTGKTTVVSTLVHVLRKYKINSVLLAPTGRAAKVLASYSKQQAFTIHKYIYYIGRSADGSMKITLGKNKLKDAVFFVDEASMIPDTSVNDSRFSVTGSLLQDLITFVDDGINCKLIFIGDTAQLPPVGIDVSPALDVEYMGKNFFFKIHHYELKDVVRQANKSGILSNANHVRRLIAKPRFDHILNTTAYADTFQINGNMLSEQLENSYDKVGMEETVIITRSNKRARLFNQEVRKRILYKEDDIEAGDLLMVVKNNYYWLANNENGFIANGDIIEIQSITNREEMYGFHFADVNIRFIDADEESVLEVKILLDTLLSDSASMSKEENRIFYEEVMKDYEDIPSKARRFRELKKNPYFNALQVKYAYALTCHKTQGGQWKHVFVDQGYLFDDMLNKEYLRWLYTAFTRARRKLFLINFKADFFEQ